MDLRKSRRAPRVEAAMTPFPHFVTRDDSVDEVGRLMREKGIRHVPVQQDGEVVGIVSDRDLNRLVNPALPAPSRKRIRVDAVMLPDPYVVEVDAVLARVVSEMAERHIGSAIVVKRGKLAGILSVTDVCRVLGELLDGLYPEDDGDEAA